MAEFVRGLEKVRSRALSSSEVIMSKKCQVVGIYPVTRHLKDASTDKKQSQGLCGGQRVKVLSSAEPSFCPFVALAT